MFPFKKRKTYTVIPKEEIVPFPLIIFSHKSQLEPFKFPYCKEVSLLQKKEGGGSLTVADSKQAQHFPALFLSKQAKPQPSHMQQGSYLSVWLGGLKMRKQGLLGGPAAGTLQSQSKGPVFNPWSGNQVPHATTKTWHSQIGGLIN